MDEAAAKLKMEITSKPLALDQIDRKVLQLEMERLSLSKAAPKDKYPPPPPSCDVPQRMPAYMNEMMVLYRHILFCRGGGRGVV